MVRYIMYCLANSRRNYAAAVTCVKTNAVKSNNVKIKCIYTSAFHFITSNKEYCL